MLAMAVFWDLSFILCSRHTLNLAKKPGLKIKSYKSNIVKKSIQKIYINKIIVQLNKFFKSHLDW